MAVTLLSATDYQDKLRESALQELVSLSSDIFKMKYEVGCIFKVKDNFNTEIDTEIKALCNYYNFTDTFRFFYLRQINWHGSKLKYLLMQYIETLYGDEFLFVKVNLDKVFTNKYFLDTIEIRGEWLDNPVKLESRYKVLYNLILAPDVTNLEVHCTICGISLPFHDYLESHSSSLHCPHHHHLIYDPVECLQHSHLGV